MSKNCGLMSNVFERFLNNFSPVISQQWYKTAKRWKLNCSKSSVLFKVWITSVAETKLKAVQVQSRVGWRKIWRSVSQEYTVKTGWKKLSIWKSMKFSKLKNTNLKRLNIWWLNGWNHWKDEGVENVGKNNKQQKNKSVKADPVFTLITDCFIFLVQYHARLILLLQSEKAQGKCRCGLHAERSGVAWRGSISNVTTQHSSTDCNDCDD